MVSWMRRLCTPVPFNRAGPSRLASVFAFLLMREKLVYSGLRLAGEYVEALSNFPRALCLLKDFSDDFFP